MIDPRDLNNVELEERIDRAQKVLDQKDRYESAFDRRNTYNYQYDKKLWRRLALICALQDDRDGKL